MSEQDQTRRLLDIMAALRDPVTGCPWDREQDFASIAPYTIEEAYEVADAIARDDLEALPDELGDLLLQVVYHSRLAEERGLFDYADVARTIADKMVRRHPHVFGDETVAPGFWEASKAAERRHRKVDGALAGVAVTLPALARAGKLSARAARVGFDWPDAPRILDKLDEEIAELRAELPRPDRNADPARIADELGDVLFTVANLARKLGIDPEACLRQANEKFTRRFEAMEQTAEAAGNSFADLDLEAMEELWRAIKSRENP